MTNTNGLQGLAQIAIEEEQRTTNKLENIALMLLSVGVASTLLTAFTALNALAAQPAPVPMPMPMPMNTRLAPNTPLITALPVPPGALKGLTAPATVDMNTKFSFHFAGKGFCTVKLDSADGSVTTFTGELPFDGDHIYSSASMSSFDAFKDYTASITPSGNCKTDDKGTFTSKVRVVNPHPQSSGASPKDNTVALAGNGKLDVGVKPSTLDTPVVLPNIASITQPSGLNAAAGGATVLTVNGTGICKYHLSYVNLDADGKTIMKAYPMLPKNSSVQTPFPMTMTLIPTTPAGIYKWTASGFEGCTGTANALLTVQ